MKVTIKNREFELNDFAHVAWIVKAICHPERLKLILFMEKNERYTVNDLIPVIGKPQPFISQHLSFLKKQGLVTLEREAQFHYFQINKIVFVRVANELLGSSYYFSPRNIKKIQTATITYHLLKRTLHFLASFLAKH